jgi:hypothetical protein
MRRLALILCSIACLLSVGIAPVAAAPPTREPFPAPCPASGAPTCEGPGLVVLVTDTCGFEVDVTWPVQREQITTFYDKAGDPARMIITGHLVVTFTNPITGKSITANISGPAHIDLINGTNTQEGRTGGPISFLPFFYLFSGRIDNVSQELHGHLIDLCPLLAP